MSFYSPVAENLHGVSFDFGCKWTRCFNQYLEKCDSNELRSNVYSKITSKIKYN